MSRWQRSVAVRVDVDAIEVSGRRLGRPTCERWDVSAGAEPFGVLENAVSASRLLRPGRPCALGVHVESSRTRYLTGEAGADDGPGAGLDVVLADGTRDVLAAILRRRRVHGRAWFGAAPAIRALDLLKARARAGPIARGLIVDRSTAAVTVLLVDGGSIRWARGAPADDAPEVAGILLRRAGEVVNGAYGLHWWHLEDVAAPDDERRRRREQREFEARCHALIGYLPRSATARVR